MIVIDGREFECTAAVGHAGALVVKMPNRDVLPFLADIRDRRAPVLVESAHGRVQMILTKVTVWAAGTVTAYFARLEIVNG